MSTITNQKVAVDLDISFAERLDLVNERDRINHHSISDDADFTASKNARRDEMKDVGSAVVNYGMSGIITALATHHHVSFRREHVNDFTFAFVAPLGSDQNRVGHFR